MNETLNILSRTPLFKGLPENQLDAISRIVVERNFSKGDTIFNEGDDCVGFFIVASGLVKIFKVFLNRNIPQDVDFQLGDTVTGFEKYWNKLHPDHPWHTNPWVAVYRWEKKE